MTKRARAWLIAVAVIASIGGYFAIFGTAADYSHSDVKIEGRIETADRYEIDVLERPESLIWTECLDNGGYALEYFYGEPTATCWLYG